jgi:hypothetical protein
VIGVDGEILGRESEFEMVEDRNETTYEFLDLDEEVLTECACHLGERPCERCIINADLAEQEEAERNSYERELQEIANRLQAVISTEIMGTSPLQTSLTTPSIYQPPSLTIDSLNESMRRAAGGLLPISYRNRVTRHGFNMVVDDAVPPNTIAAVDSQGQIQMTRIGDPDEQE